MDADSQPLASDGSNSGRNNKSAGRKRSRKAAAFTPSHILLSSFVTPKAEKGGKGLKHYLGNDPRIERDYISKRKQAIERVQWETTRSSQTSAQPSPREGVTKVERELVECCEPLPADFYSYDSDEDGGDDGGENDGYDDGSSLELLTDAIGGVLSVDKETRFAAILSRGCDTMASKCLALAILERTMKVYLAEEKSRILLSEQQQQEVAKNEADISERNESLKEEVNTNKYNREKNETAAASSRRCSRHQNRAKRPRTTIEEDNTKLSCDSTRTINTDELTESPMSATDITPTSMCQEQRKQRFRLFFAAGGLRILNQWLKDVISYETTKATSPSKTPNGCTPESASSVEVGSKRQSKDKNSAPDTIDVIRKAHRTRPLALGILRFLEHIPFEKEIVTGSKINKQVQKLGKKIALIKEAHQNGKAPKEDLDIWTTDDQTSYDDAIDQISAAVNAVKASWRIKAKTKTKGETKAINPFGSLQSKIKGRLQILKQFERGELSSMPEWYRPPLAAASVKKKPPPKPKKLTEAEIEKINLEKKIKQLQLRRQKNAQQLKEKLRQRKVGVMSTVPSLSNTKKVSWKDGPHSEGSRDKQTLAEVFIFGSELPPSAEIGGDNNPTYG